jgi:hypothetical protein
VTSKLLDRSIEKYCPAKEDSRVTEEQKHTVKEMRWNTFDQIKRRNFAVWIVTLSKDSEKKKKRTCVHVH